LHEFNCLIRIRRASALYMREYYAPEISSIEQWREREIRWRELNTRRYQVFRVVSSLRSLRSRGIIRKMEF